MRHRTAVDGSPSRRVLSDLDRTHADRIVLIYLLVAAVWIVVSGPVGAWISDLFGISVVAVELSKGLAFVLATALVLRSALRRWVARVEAAALAERDAAEQLRMAEQDRTAFVNAVSHELRTPLTSIVGFSHTVQRLVHDGEHEQVANLAERLSANAERLESLVLDLLEAGTLFHGLSEPRFRRVELGELVRRAAGTVDLGGRPVELGGDPHELDADVAKLERCVQLLLGNVVRHTPAATKVWVSWRGQDEHVSLRVEDDGPGLPPRIVDGDLAPFLQGYEAATSPSPGVGVGLTLVEQYVRLHEGVVAASNRPGGGARIELVLPRRQGGGASPRPRMGTRTRSDLGAQPGGDGVPDA